MTMGFQSSTEMTPGLANRPKALEFNVRDEHCLLAQICHELRIPITNLKMQLYLARMQPEKLDERLQIMELVTERMRSLIEDLLDTARLELGVLHLRRQRVELQALIASVIDLQRPEAERKSITLICETPAEPLNVLVDLNRMTQVLTNLVVNAITYTPTGGSVTVQCAVQDGHPVIRVADTGIGIPAEFVNKVFEPFFRVDDGSARGSGLGLTIVKEIVEAHGGTITVESEPGEGSVFSVHLA